MGMRVTKELLTYIGACQEGIDVFDRHYPNGVDDLNAEVLITLAEDGGNIDWFARSSFFRPEQIAEYEKEIRMNRELVESARRSAIARHGDPNITDPSQYAEKMAIADAIRRDLAPYETALIRASGHALARALKFEIPSTADTKTLAIAADAPVKSGR